MTCDNNVCVAIKCNGSASCNNHGTCNDSTGKVVCICNANSGYDATANCGTCLSGFHEDSSSSSCVLDTTCNGRASCSDHGTCSAATGKVVCTCDANSNYDAAANCGTCLSGFHEDSSSSTCVTNTTCAQINNCNGHGNCVETNGKATCTSCDTGYDVNTNCGTCVGGYHKDSSSSTCVLDTTCNGRASCNNHGNCDASTGKVVCTCDANSNYDAAANCGTCLDGFHEEGSSCVKNTTCADINNCNGHGNCVVTNGKASCTSCVTGYDLNTNCAGCATGYKRYQEGGECLPSQPCDANNTKICADKNETCQNINGKAVCFDTCDNYKCYGVNTCSIDQNNGTATLTCKSNYSLDDHCCNCIPNCTEITTSLNGGACDQPDGCGGNCSICKPNVGLTCTNGVCTCDSSYNGKTSCDPKNYPVCEESNTIATNCNYNTYDATNKCYYKDQRVCDKSIYKICAVENIYGQQMAHCICYIDKANGEVSCNDPDNNTSCSGKTALRCVGKYKELTDRCGRQTSLTCSGNETCKLNSASGEFACCSGSSCKPVPYPTDIP